MRLTALPLGTERHVRGPDSRALDDRLTLTKYYQTNAVNFSNWGRMSHESHPDVIRFKGDNATFGLKVAHPSDVNPGYKEKKTPRAQEAWEWAKVNAPSIYLPEDLRDRWSNFVPVRFGDKKHAALFALFWLE